MSQTSSDRQRRGLIGGIALIIIGIFAFATQFLHFQWVGVAVLGGLAVIFACWGILTRNPRLLVPGGILGGLALGLWIVQVQILPLNGTQQGAVIVWGLAAGFAAVTLLILVVVKELRIWSLIAAGILALVGLVLWVGGAALQLLSLVGQAWPLILIIIGASILWRVFRRESA